MKVSFFSRPDPRFEFEPGDEADIPDDVARRWTLMLELVAMMEREMFEWKQIGREQRDVQAKRDLIELVLSEEEPRVVLRYTESAG